MRPFVDHHLYQCLELFDQQKLPLDAFLRDYFHHHRAVGARDRRQVTERCYRLLRWRGLLDHFGGGDWEQREVLLRGLDPERYEGEELPVHVRWSIPRWIYERLEAAYGRAGAVELCRVSNTQAPTTVRVNELKTQRESLLARWQGTFQIEPCPYSPAGIRFHKREPLMALDEFKQGLFEIQDEGSQLVAQMVEARPGQRVLDYCAGAGGKSLAIGVQMAGRGQLYLHDVRLAVLHEARRRLRRAGIQNGQIITGERQLRLLKGCMDWVLVDAPCSGTGTLRRNPDAKWRLEEAAIDRLVQQQREIVATARQYLKPGGQLVYATCSLLPQENQDQVAYFERELGLKSIGLPFQSHPERGGMDAFFAARMIQSATS